jgi:hypothetical protein
MRETVNPELTSLTPTLSSPWSRVLAESACCPGRTDPRYPQPGEAIAAPPERLAYVAAYDPAGKARDAITVVDCDPSSSTYGGVIGWSELPTAGNELHSSAGTPAPAPVPPGARGTGRPAVSPTTSNPSSCSGARANTRKGAWASTIGTILAIDPSSHEPSALDIRATLGSDPARHHHPRLSLGQCRGRGGRTA